MPPNIMSGLQAFGKVLAFTAGIAVAVGLGYLGYHASNVLAAYALLLVAVLIFVATCAVFSDIVTILLVSAIAFIVLLVIARVLSDFVTH